MTDQEIIETIATKVMGWDLTKTTKLTTREFCTDCQDVYARDYNPLTNDADCMAAWDKFSEGPVYTCIENGAVSNQYHACYAADPDIEIRCDSTDRRRAMCECMARAVSA